MSEDVPQLATPVAPVADAAAEVVKTEATPPVEGAPTQADAEQAEPASDATDDKPKKPRQTANERIGELYRQKKDAERRASFAEAELARLRQPLVSQEQYESLPYTQQQQVDVRQAVREERAQELAQEVQRERQAVQEARVASFQERVVTAAETIPDLIETISNPAVPVSEIAAHYLQEDDMGPQVAYHLAKTPAEARRIAALPPIQQIAQLGMIKAKIAAASAPRKLSTAPKPVTAVSGAGGPVAKDPANMSEAEYSEWYRTRRKK